MQEVEARLSTGSTFDGIHTYVAGAASAFERNKGAFERSTALLVLTGACAHTQKRVRRAQVRDSKERAQVRSPALSEPDFPETMYTTKNCQTLF
jgi:hypothetical protein